MKNIAIPHFIATIDIKLADLHLLLLWQYRQQIIFYSFKYIIGASKEAKMIASSKKKICFTAPTTSSKLKRLSKDPYQKTTQR